MSLDWTPRYVPAAISGSKVARIIWHPSGSHGGPIRADVGALEVLLATGGKRWYGVERAEINAELRMVIAGFNAGFEEMAAWRKVPTRLVPPRMRVSRAATRRSA